MIVLDIIEKTSKSNNLVILTESTGIINQRTYINYLLDNRPSNATAYLRLSRPFASCPVLSGYSIEVPFPSNSLWTLFLSLLCSLFLRPDLLCQWPVFPFGYVSFPFLLDLVFFRHRQASSWKGRGSVSTSRQIEITRILRGPKHPSWPSWRVVITITTPFT